MKSHKDREVWQIAADLAVSVYAATKKFQKEELFGMSTQLRRSAVSISSNIAEGAARNGKKAFIQFLYISLGSDFPGIGEPTGYPARERRADWAGRKPGIATI